MPTTYSDGTVNHGDIAVTLSTAGAVVIEGFTTTRPSTSIKMRTEIGVPSKQKFIEDFDTASGVVQVPASGTKPTRFETFVYNAETWIITKCGESHTYSDYDKSQCEFARKYN